MPADQRRRRHRAASIATLAVVSMLAAAGCQPAQPAGPASSPTSATPTPHVFTVMTTEKAATFDPAGAQTGADAIVALNAFQRLMVAHSRGVELKPDAASDCLFTAPTVYECQLQKELTFANGHALTASDVKFSIERAYRLNVPGSSTQLLNSLQKVEAVDDTTVRFTLKWPDTQFGLALATPAASIVDEEVYDPDALAATTTTPAGSGPFAVAGADNGGITFVRNESYHGALGAHLKQIRLAYAPDSAAVEAAMADASADVVWRSLDTGALGRVVSGATVTGMRSVGLPETRIERLLWSESSPYRARADVRAAVAGALQGDRAWASLVPTKVTGSVASFPAGGKPTAKPIAGTRLNLKLTYSAAAPGMADLARLLRDRLEANAGVSVQLKPDATDADLVLTDRSAWLNTALGWLQSYLDAPLPGSQAKLAQLAQQARQTSDAAARQAVLAEIQRQAAVDLTVLPIAQQQETFYVRDDVVFEGDPYGPAWQLGLWAFDQ